MSDRADYERNFAISYGLTLVAGLPLPPALTVEVVRLQEAVERTQPGSFRWYAANHLHVTLAAPLRGRYRAAPAIQPDELPASFGEFVARLAAECRAMRPLPLALADLHLHRGTLSLAVDGGVEHAHRLRELLRCCEGFDLPKWPGADLHLSIGFLLREAAEDAVAAGFSRCTISTTRAGAVLDQIALVHYANRTLASVVGQVPLALGRREVLRAGAVLEQLGIQPAA